MDPIDAFPELLSTTVMPVTLPDKPDALEYAAFQGQVRAGIIYQEPTVKRECLFCFVKTIGIKKRRGWTISNGPSWRQSMSMNLDPTT
ncbi:hypothetical protein TNCV_28611 [Trichonephila clavipes]|uniref:Uncharacterized protein n=1 Tax=Trichonephila clavipes TaxID=2585209 RepID=A0A8X6WLF6_TRICX|nr:hypothetical protein TNCV_28611 [Trichonephila clavipes]